MRQGLVVYAFRYMAKSETLNGWRCLDEENKMDEKYGLKKKLTQVRVTSPH
jgi:3-deoxy-D-arabino-heptulosonate 7-phosphate (DAHP) synthase